ncbi:MAG: methyltransferase domain-containing protein [Dongiaceae bacterium]
MDDAMQVFDRRAVRLHRDRAAPGLRGHDFLLREAGERLADRLDDINRRFPLALDLGCHDGLLAELLRGRGGIERLVRADLSPAMAALARGRALPGPALAADEEALPFAPASFDLVLSNLSLHWVNDLPGCLLQVRRMLKPDGLFLACLLGGETLAELRQALLQAELETRGGASPRVSPFAEIADGAALLQRAGFALPVADSDRLAVSYPDAFRLMADLRGMGESNAVAARDRRFIGRGLLLAAAAHYQQRFADAEGRLPATFQLIFLTGWAPHDSQQRPQRPGTAAARLADALGTTEQPAGDKVKPG